MMADTLLDPGLSYFPQVDQALMKYPFDLQRTAQLPSFGPK
jgi:hypothetical protein